MKNVLLSNILFLNSLTFWLNAHEVIAQMCYVRLFKTEEDRIPVMLFSVYDNKHCNATYLHFTHLVYLRINKTDT